MSQDTIPELVEETISPEPASFCPVSESPSDSRGAFKQELLTANLSDFKCGHFVKTQQGNQWNSCSPQVSWIWEPNDGQRDNIAVFHPIYGQSFPNLSFKDRVVFLHNSLENPSIRISNLQMSDAGRYTCEYATYPSGNEQGTTTLIMLGELKSNVWKQYNEKPCTMTERRRCSLFNLRTFFFGESIQRSTVYLLFFKRSGSNRVFQSLSAASALTVLCLLLLSTKEVSKL